MADEKRPPTGACSDLLDKHSALNRPPWHREMVGSCHIRTESTLEGWDFQGDGFGHDLTGAFARIAVR